MSDIPDKELVARAQKGDRVAFETLHRRYSPLVFRRVSRLLGGGHEVDDVVQDVFVQLHRSLASFDTERPFVNWLYRITRNVALSHRRKRPLPFDPVALDTFAAPDDVWRTMVARQKVRMLDAALNHVSDEAREAFVLHTLEGLTLAEVADLTGQSINTVAARVRRTRARVISMFERAEKTGRERQEGEA